MPRIAPTRLDAVLMEADDAMPLTTEIVQRRMANGRPVYAGSPMASRAQVRQVGRQRPVLQAFTPAQLSRTAVGVPAVHALDVRLVQAVTRLPVVRQVTAPAPAGRPTFSLMPLTPTGAAPTGGIDPTTPAIPNDAATILHAQIMLANWRSAYGAACDPADFGATPADLNGVSVGGPQDRTARALTSFATWSNANFPALQPLNPDGQLDTVTYERLTAVNDAINAKRPPNIKVQGQPHMITMTSPPPAHPLLVPGVIAAVVAAYVFRRELGGML